MRPIERSPLVEELQDCLTTGKKPGFEMKLGKASNSEFIAKELKKDLEILVSTGPDRLDTIVWRFGVSPATGVGGPTKPLLDSLKAAASKGIVVECVPPLTC